MPHRRWIAGLVVLALGCKHHSLGAPSRDGQTPPPPPPSGYDGGPPPPPRVEGPAPRPIFGGTLLVDRSGRRAVVADSDRDVLWLFGLGDPEMYASGSIELEPGDVPFRLVEDGVGRVHVTLREGGAVVTIDPHNGEHLDRRAVCPAPRGIAYDEATDLLHVACAGGELVSLPAGGGAIVRQVTLDPDLRDVLVHQGRLFVSRFRAAEVLELDEAGAIALRYAPREHQSGFQEPIYAPNTAYRMRALPDGDLLLVHQWSRSGPIALSTVPRDGVGYYGTGGTCRDLVLTGLTRLRPGYGDIGRFALTSPTMAVDADVTETGSVVFVSAVADGSGVTHGLTPPLPEESDCFEGRAVARASAVAVSPRGQLFWQSEPPTLSLATFDGYRPRTVEVPGAMVLDLGASIFHGATASRLTCATCHAEGGDDGHVWDFIGTGPRRTQSLLGGVLDRAPFHWDGSLPDLTAIMDETFVARMGGDPLGATEVSALGEWLSALPAIPPSPVDAALAEAGALRFEALGCASCHAGPQLTDGQLHDVGTGGRFRTPSLVGLAVRAPYLHDGCAADLGAVLDGSCEEAPGPHRVELDEALLAYLRAQ